MRPRLKNRHLPPCVYLRHGAYWLVKRGKWERLGSELPAALSEYARKIQPKQGTMESLIETALASRRSKLAANTRKAYNVMAGKLSGILAEFRPEDVLPRHIAQIRESMMDSPGMANRAISVLRLTFGYALERQLIDSDPTVGIKRIEEPQRDRLITKDEYDRIRAKAAPALQMAMDLCYLTGQRISDVLGIRYSHLEPDGIAFRQQKTNAKLIVRWTPELRAIVETAKGLHGNLRTLGLFHNPRGVPLRYRQVYGLWESACSAAGVKDAHIHDLRAMSGTAAEAQGLDPQKLLGHTSPQNTKRYLRAKKVPVVDGPSIGRVIDNWTERSNKSKG